MSSPTSSDKPTAYRRPRANVFTFLLVLALVATLIGSFALYTVMRDYEFKIKAPTVVRAWPAVTVPAPETALA